MNSAEIEALIRGTVTDAVTAACRENVTKTIIAEVVREELKNHAAFCRFDLSDEKASEVGHMFGVMTDLGSGDVPKGIEEMRENHRWVRSMRGLSGKVGTVVVGVVLTTLAGGMFAALWAGIKFHMSK